MADLFSEAWMKSYMEEWNKEPELADKLADINFSSKIAYGMANEDKPRDNDTNICCGLNECRYAE